FHRQSWRTTMSSSTRFHWNSPCQWELHRRRRVSLRIFRHRLLPVMKHRSVEKGTRSRPSIHQLEKHRPLVQMRSETPHMKQLSGGCQCIQ
ncbi:hypothetical protein JD844_026602, partial [Phrynosoma platyrhinos]